MSGGTETNRPETGRLPGLDTLRALAILAVMLFHLQWYLPERLGLVAQFGWIGVDLFFVLSGYLIGVQLLRPVARGEAVDVLAFYRRRAWRILPAYAVVLALYVLWPQWREAATMSPLWEFVIFTENLFVDYAKNFAFSHVWSLCVEEHFYLLLPLAVVLLARKPSFRKTVAVIASLVAMGIAIRWYELIHVLQPLARAGDSFATQYIEGVYYPTYTRLDGLLAGLSMALVRTFRPAWWAALERCAVVLSLAGCAMVAGSLALFVDRFHSTTGAAAWGTVVGFPLLSLGLALLLVAATTQRTWLGRWRIPCAKPLATLAFSLYLTHKAAAHLTDQVLPNRMDDRGWISLPILAVSTLAVATLLYLAVERPGLRLRNL